MNLFDYLGSEFASFDEKPLNPLDSAALSQFCMVRCEGLVPELDEEIPTGFLAALMSKLTPPKTARFIDLLRAEYYNDMFTGLTPGRVKDNLLALAASPRFRDIALRDYRSIFSEDEQVQFAAITFVYKNEWAYVGFRGTDTTVTGWRENFNMACTAPVPAQALALHYLETVAPHLPENLYVGGHSKGANLALYAALKAAPEVQNRIVQVFSHDGPGFKEGVITPEEWKRLEGRILRTVPEESIVGMLMSNAVEPRIAKSTERGLNQHSPFTWEVKDDDFAYTNKLADSAQFFDNVVTEWLSRYSDEEAAAVVDALFKAIEASGTTNASEIFFGGVKTVGLLTRAAQKIDENARNTLLAALGSLAEVVARHASAGAQRTAASVVERFTKQKEAASEETAFN